MRPTYHGQTLPLSEVRAEMAVALMRLLSHGDGEVSTLVEALRKQGFADSGTGKSGSVKFHLGWITSYLKMAGILVNPVRGTWRSSASGPVTKLDLDGALKLGLSNAKKAARQKAAAKRSTSGGAALRQSQLLERARAIIALFDDGLMDATNAEIAITKLGLKSKRP